MGRQRMVSCRYSVSGQGYRVCKGKNKEMGTVSKGDCIMKKRFEVKEQQHIAGGIIRIIVDKETGVNYVVSSGLGVSGMTPLLDKDGKIVIEKRG